MYPKLTVPSLVFIVALIFSGTALVAQPDAAPAQRAAVQDAPPPADEITPEERMNRRYPQKVRVRDLLGLALQDDDDRILGYVERVVRTREAKIVLVTTYGSWFGLGGRRVGVPLETVAILARHIDVLDIARSEFPSLPTWQDGGATDISPQETIRIAITRR